MTTACKMCLSFQTTHASLHSLGLLHDQLMNIWFLQVQGTLLALLTFCMINSQTSASTWIYAHWDSGSQDGDTVFWMQGEKARQVMRKHLSLPSGRKNHMQNRSMELLCAIVRPPQESWSIRERINFRIALARYIVVLRREPDILHGHNPNSLSFLTGNQNLYNRSFIPEAKHF